jgi:hypothetical protein
MEGDEIDGFLADSLRLESCDEIVYVDARHGESVCVVCGRR